MRVRTPVVLGATGFLAAALSLSACGSGTAARTTTPASRPAAATQPAPTSNSSASAPTIPATAKAPATPPTSIGPTALQRTAAQDAYTTWPQVKAQALSLTPAAWQSWQDSNATATGFYNDIVDLSNSGLTGGPYGSLENGVIDLGAAAEEQSAAMAPIIIRRDVGLIDDAFAALAAAGVVH
jgi:cytoskeletal protein RodZ